MHVLISSMKVCKQSMCILEFMSHGVLLHQGLYISEEVFC